MKILNSQIKKIGYEQSGFHWKKIKIENFLHNQSSDIAIGVDQNEAKEHEPKLIYFKENSNIINEIKTQIPTQKNNVVSL